MKKSLIILILTALAATSFAAKVTNVQLAYENGETVARIEVNGQIRFTHQTEIPKDGKPDRVIVDVLSATHELGAKVFDNLPNCPITAIRTSQYSVKPEAVVRLVFDIKKTPVYQVESQGQFIVVHFVDKTAMSFPSWSSSAAPAAPAKPAAPMATAPKVESPKPSATVAQKNASAESDRQNSLAASPAKPVATTPSVTPVEKKPVTVATTPATTQSAPVNTTSQPSTPPSTATKSNPVTITSTPVTPAKTAPVVPTVENKPTTVAAVPKTEVKPTESKPATSAPALANTTPTPAAKTAVPAPASTPTVTPTVKAEVKPMEVKPTVPATAMTPATTPAVKAEVKPAEAKPTATPAVVPTTQVAKTEPKPADTKPAPVVAATPNMTAPKTEVKPVDTKPASPVTTTTQAAKPTTTVAAVPSPTAVPNSVKPNPNTAAPAMTSPVTPTNKPQTPAVAASTPATNTMPAPASSRPAASSPLAEVKSESIKPSPTTSAQPAPTQMAKPSSPAKQAYTTEDEEIPEPEDLEPAQDNPYVDHDSPAGSQMNDDDTPVDSNSTARFRRRPLSAAQIKGTMIAQFPQRLVIKYESNGARDPFATLIDDSRTFNSPTHQGVPNVDGLRLVGVIVARQTGNRALFVDKAGYSYMLKSGDKVRNGYVLRIESDRAYFQIFEYGWSRTVALKIDES